MDMPVDEHSEFEQRFEELCARTRAGEAGELVADWANFARDIETHFAFEEDGLRLLARRGPEHRRRLERFAAEHAAVRQLLAEIRAQARRGQLGAATLEVFADLLLEHVTLDRSGVYPRPG